MSIISLSISNKALIGGKWRTNFLWLFLLLRCCSSSSWGVLEVRERDSRCSKLWCSPTPCFLGSWFMCKEESLVEVPRIRWKNEMPTLSLSLSSSLILKEGWSLPSLRAMKRPLTSHNEAAPEAAHSGPLWSDGNRCSGMGGVVGGWRGDFFFKLYLVWRVDSPCPLGQCTVDFPCKFYLGAFYLPV